MSYTRAAAVRLVTEALHTGLTQLASVSVRQPAEDCAVVRGRLADGTVVRITVEIESS